MAAKKIFKAILIFTLLAALTAAGWGVSSNWPAIEQYFETQAQSKQERQPTKPPVAIDGALLQERYESQAEYQPTPEEIAEDQAFEVEQIALAKQWLVDLDDEQRIAGIEQLNAYPGAESEKLMVQALKTDRSDEVRAAAASSLSYIEKPTVNTIDTLIQALQDVDEEVRFNALNTLQSYIDIMENEDTPVKRIVNLLKQQVKAKQTPAEIREAIKDYLDDRFSE